MNHKKILPILIPILILTSGYVYFTKSFTTAGASIFLFSLSLIVTFIILLFVKNETFATWKKFAFGWLPFSALLIMSAPDYHSGLIGFDKKLTAFWMALFFFIISIVIIIVKSWKSQGK